VSIKALYPLSFDVGSRTALDYLRDSGIRLVAEFFRDKGLPALKQEDRDDGWYQDWIEFQAKHGLYAGLLSPKQDSNRGCQINIRKLTRFAEALAYFSPAHGYSLQVSFLGLFPILLSDNEALKKEAIAVLEAGGLFAFAVSEKAHGSDLFANEFTVRPAGTSDQRADGEKYYIGNANSASIITVLAKKVAADGPSASKRAPFIFFALRPDKSPGFQNVRKIRTLGVRGAFVGEFEVKGHQFPESDVISQGRDAWESLHATVNLGKFFLGFGAVGICEHALAEAIAHMRQRILYGKCVTEMPHIRATVVNAYARLTAMKLYAYRALDYVQASSRHDRRFLFFNAVQKAKVSTEGVKVMGLLSECIGARGFETETYFESALREVLMIPGLEGSTHINYGLTAQFLEPYFADFEEEALPPKSLHGVDSEVEENPYWMSGQDRDARTVRFGHCLRAYRPLRSVANVRAFVQQVKSFRQFAAAGLAELAPSADMGLLVGIGKCLANIAFAQLVAENCAVARIPRQTVSIIFQAMIEDLSTEAIHLSAMYPMRSTTRELLKRVVRVPKMSPRHVEAVSRLIASRYVAGTDPEESGAHSVGTS